MKLEDVRGMIFIPRSDENIYSTLEKAKFDAIQLLEAVIQEISEKHKLKIELTHSLPYSGSIWIQLRALVLENDIQRRLQTLIILTGHDFHKYPVEYTIEFQENDKAERISAIYSLDKSELYKLLDSLISGVSLSSIKLNLNLPQFRTVLLEFWLPKNTIDRLSSLKNILYILGFVIFIFSVFLASLFLLALSLIMMAFWITLSGLFPFRKKYIITSGKPFFEPRNLSLIDSWQSVIFKLGTEFEKIKLTLISNFTEFLMTGCQIKEEKIWYWGLDGKVERSQLVITNNRGIAFIHIYPYGDDLYIGWDVHINYGQWVEKNVATGKDKQTGKFVTLKSITPGWQSVNEYDVQDAVSLGEWCHAQLVKVVKLAMKEHEIDQEINFQILRESRAGLTEREERKEGNSIYGGIKRVK